MMNADQQLDKLAELLCGYIALTEVERRIFHVAFDKYLKDKQEVI